MTRDSVLPVLSARQNGVRIESAARGSLSPLTLVRRAARGDSGASLVETAVALPVIAMLVFGIAKFGIAYNNYIMLTDAVRASVRQLSVSRGQANPCSAAIARLYGSAPTLTASSLTVSLRLNNVATSYGGTQGVAASCSGATLNASEDVKVIASYPCSLTIFGINFAPSCSMQSQSTVRIE